MLLKLKSFGHLEITQVRPRLKNLLLGNHLHLHSTHPLSTPLLVSWPTLWHLLPTPRGNTWLLLL
jgi:hypothetical protein